MTTTSTFETTRSTLRRTRRAYIGAHVLAFEFAANRVSKRLTQLRGLSELLVLKGETVETEFLKATETARDKLTDILPGEAKVSVEIDVQPTAKRQARKVTRPTPKAKPSSKTRIKTDKTFPTAKADAKATPKAKASPKPAAQVGQILDDKYAAHITAVTAYDADANPVMVKKIVDHLGIALQSRDGRTVACSDATERETVANSWLLKKLGVEADAAALDAKVKAVCDTMKANRMKSRVVFYYLLAKNEGKLGTL